MADTRRLAAVAEVAKRAGAKLVLIGDDRQLAPVETGGALLALATRVGAVRLSDNRRQRDAWQREALAAIRDGRASEAARAYLTQGRVKVADSQGELLALMVSDWWAAREGGEEASMWAYSREAVSELNARARAHLGATGALGDRELVVAASVERRLAPRRFAAGDEVVCLHNRKHLPRDPSGRGVRNGTLATVIDVGSDGLDVQTAGGRSVRLPRRYVKEWLDYSYAMTVHKTQGRTLGQVEGPEDQRRRGHAFVYGAAGLSGEAALVAASRATDVTELYVCAIPPSEPTSHGEVGPVDPYLQLSQAWSTSRAKTAATDLAAEGERVCQLAALSTDELHRRLADLELMDPATERGLRGALADADRRLAPSRDALGARPILPMADPAQRDANATLSQMRYLNERLARRQALLEQWRGDVRAVTAERDRLNNALRTRRRWQRAALGVDPPTWANALLGPAPFRDRARAQLWWEGLSAALDIRQQRGLNDAEAALVIHDGSPWRQAIGLDPDSPDALPWRSAIATIRHIRARLAAPERPVPAHSTDDVSWLATLARHRSVALLPSRQLGRHRT